MNIEEIIDKIGNRKIICFYGEMGAGKTTMIKQIVEYFGTTDIVNSPTFSIINEYHLDDGALVYHMDLYRLNSTQELISLGFDDYITSGNFVFIEWPEIAEDLLEDDFCRIRILVKGNGEREVVIS